MAKLPVIPAARLVRALKCDGWYEHHARGSHLYLRHTERPGQLTVPMHRGRDLLPKTLKGILKQDSHRKS
jgi:predicted RNA binding protein YcfA (HicA-like mRNA interferase family)